MSGPPYRVACAVAGHIKIPDRDSFWRIRLINGKEVTTKIYRGKPYTWQSALAYKWHVPSINALERIINEYYNCSVPYVDIGANVGLRSLLYLSSGRPVFMIEPNVELNILNEERCNMNKFMNYQIFNICLSNINGEAPFYYDASSYESGLRKELIRPDKMIKSETVKLSTLDVFTNKYLPKCSNAIIKIDVEGHEFEVIKGGYDFISNVNPTMLVEINEKGQHIAEIISFMKKLRYSVYEVRERQKVRYYKLHDGMTENYVFREDDYLFTKEERLEKLLLG
ncbi:MAG: FkbM family methyltransferase [Candidatus Omnitrophota bacterium]